MTIVGIKTSGIWQDKRAQWGIFLIAVLIKALLLGTYLQIDGDRALQVTAAIEIAKGLGYTVPQVRLEHLNLAHSYWLLEWPPLYSGLLAPLLVATNFDITLSSIILETAGLFFYMLAIWKLAAHLRFPLIIQMMLVGFKATEAYEGLLYSFATDFHAAGCLLWALLFFLQFLETNNRKYVITAALCMIGAILFRYAYVPAVFIFPLMLVWNGWKTKNQRWIYGALFLFLTLVTVLLVYMGYNQIKTGSFTYLGEWQKGFYPWKLQYLLPLFWQAITHVTFISVQVEEKIGIQFRYISQILQWSSHLLLILLASQWWLRNKVKGFLFTDKRDQKFFLLSGIISLSILGLLAALTLRIDIYHGDASGGGWSYLMEDRYFLFPLTVILFAIAHLLYQIEWKNTFILKILQRAFISAFCLQLLHTGWMISRRLPKALLENPARHSMAAERWDKLDELFQEGRAAGNDIVLFSRDYGAAYWALQNNVKIFRYIGSLGDASELRISKPTTVVLILPEFEIRKMRGFLDRYQFRPKNIIAKEVQFITHLKPGKP